MKSIWRGALVAMMVGLTTAAATNAQDTKFQIRVRGIAVAPTESATITVINGDVDIDVAYVPEVDLTLFFTPNLAAELILATTKHNAAAIGTDLGAVDLGSIWLLPPTLTLQYHFLPAGPFSPYIGAGGNLTFFYNADVPGTTVTDASYSTSGGFAVQAGADIAIGDGPWFVNVDAKKIFLSTDVELNDASILADVTIDPWVLGAGFGYRIR